MDQTPYPSYRLPNGNIMAATRFENADGVIGDGVTEVTPGDDRYAALDEHITRYGESPRYFLPPDLAKRTGIDPITGLPA